MDSSVAKLIESSLSYLRLVAKTTPSVFATREEIAYFTSKHVKEAPLPNPSQKTAIIIEQKPEKKLLPPQAPSPIATIAERQGTSGNESSVVNPTRPKPDSSGGFSINEMRQVVEKTFPGFVLRDTVLDDTRAKKMSRLWEETYLNAQIAIIAFGETGANLQFLKNVTYAIDSLIAPAQLIDGLLLEKEKGWDLLLSSPALKCAICSPWQSWKSTSLSAHYRQNGSTQQQFLGPHKLLLLEPIAHYLKDPDRKRRLWQLINTQLLS